MLWLTAMAAPIQADALSAAGIRSRRGRILVVDDEPILGRALSKLLSREHQVETVTSARDALGRLVCGERYDVILCDVTMPGMSGVDFHDEVARKVPAQAGRIVFLTGGVSSVEWRARIEASRRVVLEKPVDVDRLRAVVDAHVAEELWRRPATE